MADYAWPRPALNLNYDLTSVSVNDFTSWTEAGGVTALTGGSAYGGSGASASIPDGGSMYQDITLKDSNGCWVSMSEDLRLDLVAKPLASLCDGLGIQVFLYDGSTLKYTYDFHAGKWESPEESDLTPTEDEQTSYWLALKDNVYTDWTAFHLPRIYAPIEAGVDVEDDWKLRIRLRVDNTSGGAAMGVDNIRLSYWASTVKTDTVGQFTVFSNGHNYPVKHDAKGDTVTELSLHPPYAGTNSLPTVTTATTGGFLEDSLYYGYVYFFLNPDIPEYSAPPLGVQASSGAFTQQVGSGTNTHTIDVDYTGLELPNSETNKTTDNTVGTRVVQFRTKGYSQQQDAEDDIYAGLVYYEGEAAVGGTITSTLSDDDLVDQGGLSDFGVSAIHVAAPHFTVSHAYRSRLWVAGGREYTNGSVTVTQNSKEVVGVAEGGSDAATLWGRGVEFMTFTRDTDGRQYDIEEFWYENDDGASGTERIILTEDYAGASGAKASYSIRPKNGRVWFSEEGNPGAFSASGFLLLDGAEGDAVTMIGHAGQYLVACTKDSTFLFNYGEYPTESGQSMQAVSRDLGCVAPRTFTEIDGVAYWLSARGPVRCEGGRVELLEPALRDMFTDPDDPDYVVRRRYSQLADDCCAAHNVADQSWALAVRTKNAKQGCDVVILYNHVFDTWDILRYNNGIANIFEATDDDGNPRLMCADAHGHIWKMNVGYTDGAGEVNNSGQLRGKVETGSTLFADISAGDALFVAAQGLNDPSPANINLDGVYIKAMAGTGKGTVRRIHHSTANVVYFDEALDTAWDSTTVWALGGIDWEWRFKNTDLGSPGHVKSMKFMQVDESPLGATGTAEVRVYPNNGDRDWHTEKGIPQRIFHTGHGGRRKVTLDDAAGYALRIKIRGDGPENPLEIRHLSATMESRESD